MRQLLPDPVESVDPVLRHAEAARPTPADRPWVLVNMVTTIDGATATGGVSGDLGGDADRQVFSAIRAVADVVVAAAGTVRAEGYGPPRTPPARRAEREARGQTPFPRLAVVSRSLDLDAGAPLFTEAPEPTLVFTTTSADPERVAALRRTAEVVDADDGQGSVSPSALLAHLHAAGARTVLVEGGPALNGAFLDADLIDEVNVTTEAALLGGASARLVSGAAERLHRYRLAHLWAADSVLLARYVRD